MPDWSAIVRARLTPLGLDAERDDAIRSELAGHLEDAYADARRRGCAEDDAVARALERVPDWTHLSRTIRAAQKDDPMSHDTKTLWMPGMAALCGAAAVIVIVTRALPSSLWVNPRATVPMTILMLASYLACGALGAWWSRRAGGSVKTRFFAGIFPLALHLAIIITAIVVGMLTEARVHPEHLRVNFQLRVLLAFVVIPGVALTVGTLPFLRNASSTRAA